MTIIGAVLQKSSKRAQSTSRHTFVNSVHEAKPLNAHTDARKLTQMTPPNNY